MIIADAPVARAPELSGPAPTILAISAPYYKSVVEGMLESAKHILAHVHAEITDVEVAGAFELPQALSIAVASGKVFDGYIVLGCVVRGETDHYEFICASTLDGLLRIATEQSLCLGTAVLTVDTLAQAVARSHETGSNKGAEAAVACLKQIALKRALA